MCTARQHLVVRLFASTQFLRVDTSAISPAQHKQARSRATHPCPTGLRHRGFDAHVFEGAEVLRRETSTMVGLGPNAFMVSVLATWGSGPRAGRHTYGKLQSTDGLGTAVCSPCVAWRVNCLLAGSLALR